MPLLYNLREVCEYIETTIKSAVNIYNLALRPNYPLPHYNHATVPGTVSLAPFNGASRCYTLNFLYLHLQSQQDQEGPRWQILLSMVTIVRYEILDTLYLAMQVQCTG